jgi:hypothetical protein
VDAGGLRFRIGNEAVKEPGRVPKRLGLHLVVLGVLDQQNRVKPLGRTLSSLAEEWRKNPPAVISRSVALVIPDKGLPKKGRGRLARREIIYGPGQSRAVTGNRAGEPPGTKLISRAEGSKS